jgi:mRNA degradation ribonuclease J1/J2
MSLPLSKQLFITILFSFSVSWNIIDRVRMILKSFIFEGQAQSEDTKKRMKEAKEKLEKLRKQPERLKQDLKREMDGLIKNATKRKFWERLLL